jgi:hypothetical protein
VAKKAKRAKGARRAAETKLHRSCGTMAVHMLLLETVPSFRARQAKLEQDYLRLRAFPLSLAKLATVTIGVVVNVVYQTDDQNVSNAQIKSQIAVLNKDFSAKNPDKANVPAAWKGLVTDSRIRFRLHKVTRTKTPTSSFSFDDSVKRASSGGIAPFQPQKFLNLWVCALGGGLLGYAQFPGGPTPTDGVVINCQAFGTSGTARAPFDKGRTATHEVGHYFNLRHIWGDTEDCSGSDLVADTPNCAGPNFGKPAFPNVTCDNGPNGDMFVNYMDYVDDAAMFMFTAQQVTRMRSALKGPRSGLI